MFKTELNGKRVESFDLTEQQFNRACELLNTTGMSSPHDHLNISDINVEAWIEEYADTDYGKWLKKCADDGAYFYTYYRGWQPVSEIALVYLN